MYLLTQQQQAFLKADDHRGSLVSLSFRSLCLLSKDDLVSKIHDFLTFKEASFLALEEKNGLEGLLKKEETNVVITFVKEKQVAHTSKYYLYVAIDHVDERTIQVNLETTALYYDSWSLLKCAEGIHNIASGASNEQEEQISYLQYLGWKETLLSDPDEDAVTYWKLVSKKLQEQTYNWVIPKPNTQAKVGSGKLQKITKSDFKNNYESIKDTLRGLWINLISMYVNTEELMLFERISSRVFEQLEDTFGAMDAFVPLDIEVVKSDSLNQAVQRYKETSETAANHINYYSPENNQTIPKRTAAYDYGVTILSEIESYQFEQTPESSLTLQVLEQGEQISWRIVYVEALFDPKWIDELTSVFGRGIQRLNTESIDSIATLFASEATVKEETIIPLNHFWNSFSSQVQQKPENIAIRTSIKEISYQELDEQINKVAFELYKQGIHQDKKVVVDVRRSLETIVVILAILKNKATFIPVDFDQGESRVSMILKDVEPDLVISHSVETIAHHECTMIDSLFSTQNDGELPESKSTDHTAYILYTSGSTGTPKGCPIKMSSLENYLTWCSKNYFESDENGHFSWFTPLTFDLTLTSIFLPLFRGTSLKIFDSELDTSESLQQYLTENTHCDAIKLTPAHITLLDNLDLASDHLKTIIIGGDILRPKHVQILQDRCKGARYYNEYGPTEATIGCVVKEIKSPEAINVGKPIENMMSEVMDIQGNILPAGVIGELCLSGAGLTVGYWNREDLNAKAFFQDSDGNCWYRTGDLSYKDLSGELQVIGRKDAQIKIRGYRIELNEITSFIEQIEEVSTCELLIIGEEDNISIVACVESKNDAIKTQIKEKVQSHFPDYMVPADFVVFNNIPINKNGKTDRKKLRELYEQRKATTFESPANETEVIVLELWSSIFERTNISVTSDFFEEGGHSLNATKLVSLIRKRCGVAFTLKDIYKSTSIREQARFIQERKISETLEKAPDSQYYELTPTQKLFWISEQKSESAVQYTMPTAFRFEGELDLEALKRAFQYVVNKHEVFSTRVAQKEGIPFATHVDVELPWSHKKVNSLQEIEAAIVQNNLANFDLSKGPLFRIEVLEKVVNEYYILMNFHHLIFDGWSEKVFFDDLQYGYNSYLKGKEPQLVPLEWKPKDFAHWINKKTTSKEYQKQLEFWEAQFQNVSSETAFPPHQDAKASLSNDGTSKAFRIDDPNLLEKLESVSKQNGVTPFSLWLRLFKVLLYKYTGETNWTVGIPFANRAIPELRDQIGCYLNMLPVPSQVKEDLSWTEQLREEHQKITQIIANNDCSYQDISTLYNEIHSEGKPLYDVMLTWMEDEIESNSLEGIKIEKLNNEKLESKLNFVMSVRKRKAEIEVEYDFRNSLFTEEFITRFHHDLVSALQSCFENTDQKIDSFQITGEENRIPDTKPTKSTFIKEWTKSVQNYGNHPCVIDDQKHTYREVDLLSNRYANIISQRSQSDESPIIAVEGFSGHELITIILGILKSGAIYLPIDANWPEGRKHYVLEHSECRLLMTKSIWEVPSQVTILDQSELASSEDVFIPGKEVRSDDWAYVLFTSGSTGKPKGVQIKHEAFINMIQAQIDVFQMNPDDVTLTMASVAFDASLSEYFMALFSGGTLCFPTQEEKKSPQLLQQRIEEVGVTTITLTPSMLKVFKGSIESIQKLICAGEALYAEDLKELPKELKIFNAYGPTECAVCASMYELNKTETAAIPIGKATRNLKLKVMLPNRTEAPKGIKGTLCVGGWTVSSSYLNNPIANEEKYFVLEENGEQIRYYDTGDLVVKDENNNLIYLERLDHQVQISGQRVELNEIKTQLLAIDEIKDAIVHYSKNQGHFLIAWIIGSSTRTEQQIKEVLREHLPEYMIPTDLIFLDKIPLNSSGKSDIPSLLNAFYAEKRDQNDTKESKYQEMIAIWKEILLTENVFDETDFFTSGGNSLKAIQLISKVQEHFGTSINIKSIYEHSVLEDFVQNLDHDKSIEDQRERSKREVYVASPAQKRFWILNSMNENSKMLHMPLTLLLKGNINKEEFISSINVVLQRHEVYKSRFEFKEGELFVQFDGSQPTCLSFSEPQNQEDLCNILLDHSFDLEEGNLIRILFEETTSGAYFFGVNINHIIADNWSAHLLLKEIFEEYQKTNITGNQGVIQYAQFLESFEMYQNSEDYQSAEMFWQQIMDQVQESTMKSLESTSIESVQKDRIHELWKASEFSIEHFGELGYSPYQYWLTLLSLTNYALSEQKDLAVVSPVAARTQGEFAQTHGLFMNMNPVLSQLDDQMVLSDYLSKTKEQLTKAKDYEEYPYAEMLRGKSIREQKALNEFIQVELQVNEIDDLNSNVSLPKDISVEPIEEGNDFMSRKYALEFHFNKYNNEWEFVCLWDKNKYSKQKIASYAKALPIMAVCIQGGEKETIADLVKMFKEKQSQQASSQKKEQKRKLANSFINMKI